MKVTCSECGRDFVPQQKMLKERSAGDELIEVYFSCPHCNTDFRAALHNAETKKLQKRIRKSENAGSQEQAAKLKVQLKEEMGRINGK